MSDTKFTPGPWVAFYKNKYDEWHVSLPVAGSSFKMALCPDGIQSQAREADAHLIAAAPELYEALHMIRHLWAGHSEQCASIEGGISKCDCDWPKVRTQCDAALAKARGEQS